MADENKRIAPRRDELITSDNRMTQRFAEFLELQTDTLNNLDEKSGVQDSLIALSNRQRGKITNLEQEVDDLKEMIFELSARKKPIDQEPESNERLALNKLQNKITQLTNRLNDIEALQLSPNKNKLTALASRLDDIEVEAGHNPKPPIINPLFVVGPGSAVTDNAIVKFDGTTGLLEQESGIICDDSDNLTGVAGIAHSENIVPADGKGLDFSAYTDGSVAGSTTSQILLDYEEGTWTPVLSDGTNDATHVAQIGFYTKVGRMVSIMGRLITTSLGSVSGNIEISGLPYTSVNIANYNGVLTVGFTDGFAITAGEVVTGVIEANTAVILLRLWDATTGNSRLIESDWTDDGAIMFTATYYV